jgi:DNA-directed RNA polymerase subunit M/transcription elongation factor TFIIS
VEIGGIFLGSIIRAVCDCGFESQDIFAGGGFVNFMTDLAAPALCQHCHSLIVANYLENRGNCQKCGNIIVFYNDPSLRVSNNKGTNNERYVFYWRLPDEQGEFALVDTLYFCPKCNKMMMKFIDVGCWD